MDQKRAFVCDFHRDRFPTMTELCAHYGIARRTGYTVLHRFALDGQRGLVEQSRRPHRSPRATPAATLTALLTLRQHHPHWGARKLVRVLARRHPGTPWPAPSTAARLLRQAGATRRPRRRPRPAVTHTPVGMVPAAPNDVWTVDFKGAFLTGDHRYCYPLTVLDSYSRCALTCCATLRPTEAVTRAAFSTLFARVGLPRVIRSDNGAPFASTGLGGLTTLSAWWWRLGITVERGRPRHPEDNPRHERFHRTLKQETARPPAASCRSQQRRFARFVVEYNELRPHEALGDVPPAVYYRPSPRPLPRVLPPLVYPGHFAIRRVGPSGSFTWAGARVFASKALTGIDLGFEEIDEGLWAVYFGPHRLDRLDVRTHRMLGAPSRARRTTAAFVGPPSV